MTRRADMFTTDALEPSDMSLLGLVRRLADTERADIATRFADSLRARSRHLRRRPAEPDWPLGRSDFPVRGRRDRTARPPRRIDARADRRNRRPISRGR
ncbi:hypothetical protein [Actinocrispum sp. NPDC049592]|uniref:hypothetical protein n=1 Tax=Actinocrispum sp. NPDC049592 TaxID=3154835 RepID=UPI00343C25AE